MERILIVDDDRPIRNTLKEVLELEGFKVDIAKDGSEALKVISKYKFNLIITDIAMEPMSGPDMFKEVLKNSPEIPFVFISGFANVATAVELMKEGAYDIIEKPLDINLVIQKVRDILSSVEDESTSTPKAKPRARTRQKQATSSVEMIGESDAIKDIYAKIEAAAPSDARVLISGENGTGKELVAQLIHSKSSRANAPIIEVNCAAIPSELLESELFGHEKGAFTGAVASKKGTFELAHNGTLFLDEIGDLSLSAQAKILRVLQEGYVITVGGNKAIKTDTRLIAATNKNLREEIKNGNFREDLYHRLGAAVIKVPPLRERNGDVTLLINHFLEKFVVTKSLRRRKITPEAYLVFENHHWSGNVRELQNIVERLLIFGADEISGDYAQRLIDEDY